MSKAKLIRNLCLELDELGEKRELSMADLEKAEKLSTAAKNLMKMEAMEGGGYSGDGESYARGRYSRDGYSREGYSRDGYSRRDSYDGEAAYDDGGYSGRRRYSRDAYAMDDDPKERMDRFRKDMRW